jgi:hypothetical protein
MCPRFANEDAVSRADVDDEHLAVDMSNLDVNPRHSACESFEAHAMKAAARRGRPTWIPADHAVLVDLNSRIVFEDKVTQRSADPDCGCGQTVHAVLAYSVGV